jgi:hypothetical protein
MVLAPAARMIRRLVSALLLLAPLACAGGGSTDPAATTGGGGGKADDPTCPATHLDSHGICRTADGRFAQARCCQASQLEPVCLPDGVGQIPPLASLGFLTTPCLIWNRGDITPGDDDHVPFDTADVVMISYQSIDDLTVAQLRITVAYFSGMDTSHMTVEELEQAGEGPLYYLVVDKHTGAAYDRIDIALGDNPHDLLFKHGTLVPAVVVADDSVKLCNLQ